MKGRWDDGVAINPWASQQQVMTCQHQWHNLSPQTSSSRSSSWAWSFTSGACH